MSGKRGRHPIIAWEVREDGVRNQFTTWVRKLQAPTFIPRAERLVDVHDRNGHLLAVLARNGEGEPLVWNSGDPAAPMLVLHVEESLLSGAMGHAR